MGKKRLLWQLYPVYLFLTVAAIGAALTIAYRSLKEFYLHQTASALEAGAQLVGSQLSAAFPDEPTARVDSLLKLSGSRARLRLTVILPDGRVAGDSHENPAVMENHAGRPEVIAALRGESGRDVRLSHTLNTQMMYVAIPLMREGKPASVVRAALPLASVDAPLRSIVFKLLWSGMALALIMALVTLFVSRRLAQPLEKMRRAAERFAQGDFRERMPASTTLEISALADAVNKMTAALDERIKTIERQGSEQVAILSSMAEGVVAVGADERILSFNRAASELFGVSASDARGKKIYEVIRVPQVQAALSSLIEERSLMEKEITLHGNPERELFLRGTPLLDSRGVSLGALLVVNDRTHLKKLENIRREFAANVSHELKTPLTAIKGFLETLLDGAVDNPKEAKRFLTIAAEETHRLNSLIDDLLRLAHIEQSAEQEGLLREIRPLAPVLKAAADLCEKEAAQKGIVIELGGDGALSARIHAPLLEQALINLVDNAIKYSGVQKPVAVTAEKTSEGTVIRVADQGVGIAAEHLPRLFERFYRVDKSRSKKLGGTGLGLSIVKHIALVHGGRVEVESSPGKGTTFSLYLKD